MADKRSADGNIDSRPTKRGFEVAAIDDAIRRLAGKSPDTDSKPIASGVEGQPVQNFAHGHDYSRETQRRQAEAIDALFAKSNAAEAEAKFRDPKRKLIYNPRLEPTDAEWKEHFAFFRDLLLDQERNVRSILDTEFEEAQRILIEPVEDTGIISQGQDRNTVEYKKFLEAWREKAKDPKIAERMPDFHDNLPNKLVMLRFGLPIEPITLMNILHSSDQLLADDPPDDPEELPRVERIVYSEKPLQFLDNYHERSHGYPILRQPKSKFSPPREEGVGSPNSSANTHGHHFGNGNTNPIFPPDTDVKMRGGTGLYGPGDDLHNDEIGVDDSPVDFHASQAPPAPPSGPLRFNKERYTAPAVEKQKIEIWSTWQTEQHRQDGLHHRSYIKDQSVIEPGQNPAAPLYGSSVELELSVSSSFPTVYSQRLTPTDIRELAEENRTLRNAVLDRTKICPICSKKTSGFDRKEIELHYKEHLQQIQECAKCPICETEQWGFMILKEKKDHLLDHQDRREIDRIRTFWKHLQCPVCDHELRHLDPRDILNHIADHNPGKLQ
ncbi:hypothetical protein B7494_g4231 [Chlorociboria aeruginascens]|nr:hypothetical protein B7494_g4231 [Chlorociboria aeruginascens]